MRISPKLIYYNCTSLNYTENLTQNPLLISSKTQEMADESNKTVQILHLLQNWL